LSNYDRPRVYSNKTVDDAAHCFTDVTLQATDLAVHHFLLDSPISLTGFLTL